MLDCIVPEELLQDFDKDRPEDPYLTTNLYPVYRDIVAAVNPTSILEIGSRFGYSFAVALDAGPSITRAVSIDMTGDFLGHGGMQGASAIMEKNIRLLKVDRWPNVFLDFQDINTQSVKKLDLHGQFDLIFLDGDLSEMCCLHDLYLVMPLLSDKGVIVVDDIDWFPGLRGLVENFSRAVGMSIAYYPDQSRRGKFVLSGGSHKRLEHGN